MSSLVCSCSLQKPLKVQEAPTASLFSDDDDDDVTDWLK